MSRTRTKFNAKTFKKEVRDRLVAQYTLRGRGVLVVFDPETDVSWSVEGAVSFGEPSWDERDGGMYAEEWMPGSDFFLATDAEEWEPARRRAYLSAIKDQFKAGATPPKLVKPVALPGSGVRLGLRKENPHHIIAVLHGEVIAEWAWEYDGVSPPCCSSCIEEQHDVELDGRCPHGRPAYTVRKRLI